MNPTLAYIMWGKLIFSGNKIIIILYKKLNELRTIHDIDLRDFYRKYIF